MSFDIPEAKKVSGIGYYTSSNYTPADLMDRIDRMFDTDMPLDDTPGLRVYGKVFKITVTVEEA